MKHVFRKRLLKLADFLETVPREKFDYSSFAGEDWNGNECATACGTTACALGWATAIKSFRRATGLHLTNDSYGGRVQVSDDEGNGSFVAASRLFGITTDEAEYLFMPETYLTMDEYGLNEDAYAPASDASPKDVAKHIRKFIKLKDAMDACEKAQNKLANLV